MSCDKMIGVGMKAKLVKVQQSISVFKQLLAGLWRLLLTQKYVETFHDSQSKRL